MSSIKSSHLPPAAIGADQPHRSVLRQVLGCRREAVDCLRSHRCVQGAVHCGQRLRCVEMRAPPYLIPLRAITSCLQRTTMARGQTSGEAKQMHAGLSAGASSTRSVACGSHVSAAIPIPRRVHNPSRPCLLRCRAPTPGCAAAGCTAGRRPPRCRRRPRWPAAAAPASAARLPAAAPA